LCFSGLFDHLQNYLNFTAAFALSLNFKPRVDANLVKIQYIALLPAPAAATAATASQALAPIRRVLRIRVRPGVLLKIFAVLLKDHMFMSALIVYQVLYQSQKHTMTKFLFAVLLILI
jgi:hypothetical protein